MPANTGKAGAIHRVGFFAGMPAPTGIVLVRQVCKPQAPSVALKNAFVLWPLSLLAPELVHPGAGKRMAQLWQEAQIDQVLAPVAFEWRGLQLTPT